MLRYAITDRRMFSGDETERRAALLQQAAALAARGIDFVQLREKDLAAGALAVLARDIRAALGTHASRPRLLINSRPDIALATRADGVHLASAPGSLTPSQIRKLYACAKPDEPFVSVSCHTLDEVRRARDDAADLILFGPVFEKVVVNHNITEGCGLDLLRAASALCGLTPVLALGGVTAEKAQICCAAGASGFAAIRSFLMQVR